MVVMHVSYSDFGLKDASIQRCCLSSIKIPILGIRFSCNFLTNATLLLHTSLQLLTHRGLVLPYGGIDLCQHWLR